MEVRQALRSAPLFSEALDETIIDELANTARVVRFEKGETIIREGEPGESLYIILSGTASVSTADGTGRSRVANLREGQIFGEISLLTGMPRLGTVVADDDIELAEITKPMVRQMLASSPRLLRRFASLLQKRQSDLDQIITDPEFWRRFGQSGENLSRVMQRNFDL